MSVAETYLSEKQTKNDFYRTDLQQASSSPAVTAMSLEENIQMQLPWVYPQFEPIWQLTENWDGYGATTPDPALVKIAMSTLACLKAGYHAAKPFISPTRSGGVCMEWEEKNHYFEITVESSTYGTYLYKNMETSDVWKGRISSDGRPEFTFLRAAELVFLK